MMYRKITEKQYNVLIGLVLLWGFGINALMCPYAYIFESWNPVALLIGYFVVAFIGIIMSLTSDNPIISFIGYNLVVLPVGIVLSIFVSDFYVETVVQTFIVTSLITIFMIMLSVFYPRVFLSMGKVLFAILMGVLIVEIGMLLFRVAEPNWFNALVALLFCGYIGYDWAKAQKKEKTVDNAIDAAVDLYLDIVNLFIRLLALKEDK